MVGAIERFSNNNNRRKDNVFNSKPELSIHRKADQGVEKRAGLDI
tara:strand:- start:1021 stop:1155 length:135 start_codon:yes stop_codon:yes gene_type:complete